MMYHAKKHVYQIQCCMLQVSTVLFEQIQMEMDEKKISHASVLNYIFHLHVMLDFKHLLLTTLYSATLYCMYFILGFPPSGICPISLFCGRA